MSHQTLGAGLEQVEWRDLASLRPWEAIRELLLPVPWLGISLLCAHYRHYLPAFLASFLFFLAGLRLVHDAWHRTTGLPRWAGDAVIALLSVLMLGSMHAIRVTHMVHHRQCLEDEDIEGRNANLSLPVSILSGPVFFLLKHLRAWEWGKGKDRWWMALELALNATWLVVVFWAFPVRVLEYHVTAMALGQCLFPFFSVWLVHRSCQGYPFLARTLRRPLLNLAAFGMLYHAEHHLFPAVPTCQLPRLAERIDIVAPAIREKSVF